jgi:hypothetical protein
MPRLAAPHSGEMAETSGTGINMTSAANIIVSLNLDTETIGEIELVRDLRLDYYQSVLKNPESTLEALKQAGLTEETSSAQVAAFASAKIQEIIARISNPTLIYDDEISIYVNSLLDDSSSEDA